MNDTITIIYYRGDGIDYCRGCVMGRSESIFEIDYYTDAKEARKEVIKLTVADKKIRSEILNEKEYRNYCPAEITVLINGKHQYDGEPEFTSSEQTLYDLVMGDVEKEASQILVTAVKEHEQKVKEDRRNEVDRQKNYELAQLAKLKAKYEGGKR